MTKFVVTFYFSDRVEWDMLLQGEYLDIDKVANGLKHTLGAYMFHMIET